MRTLLREVIVAMVASGAGLVAWASPAVAAPTVEFDVGCGAVIARGENLAAGETVALAKNGVFHTSKTAGEDGDGWRFDVGVAPDDELRVTVEGSPTDVTFTYQPPQGCDAPAISFSIDVACYNVVIVYENNTGPREADNFRAMIDGTSDTLVPLTFPVGESTTPVAVVPKDGLEFAIHSTAPLPATWLNHDYVQPQGCPPRPGSADDSIDGVFTDDCDGVGVEVTSDVAAPRAYVVRRDQQVAAGGVVASAAPSRHEIAAQPGAVFFVYTVIGDVDPEGDDLVLDGVASHIHAEPASCAGAGSDDGLPVTGPRAGLIAGGGIIVLGLGLVLYGIGQPRHTTRS
jgi:hypothetical protein